MYQYCILILQKSTISAKDIAIRNVENQYGQRYD